MNRKTSGTVALRMESQTQDDGIGRLASSVEALADQIEVLRDAIDECRVELAWAVQNGKAVIVAVPCTECSTVKEMAADPSSSRWGEQLRITKKHSTTDERTEIKRLTATVESLTDTVTGVEIGIRWLHGQVAGAVDAGAEQGNSPSHQSMSESKNSLVEPKKQQALF